MDQNDDQSFLEIVAEIREFIRASLAARAGVQLSRSDDERTFAELGLDSASQLQQLDAELSERFGVTLAGFGACEHRSPASFARCLAHVLAGDDEPETLRTGSSPPAASRSEPQAPLRLALARSVESE